ncbi:hypothetical protein D1872_343010 [compost metagenome]
MNSWVIDSTILRRKPLVKAYPPIRRRSVPLMIPEITFMLSGWLIEISFPIP